MMILDFTGKDLDKTPATVKMRLMKTYRKSGQTIQELNMELKMLSEKDMTDFRDMFEKDGYPTTMI